MMGSVIEGNRHVRREEVERRLNTLWRPYHAAVGDAIVQAEPEAVLVSIHSFTPQLKGRPKRPWHVGLLWDRDDRLVAPLLARLRAVEGIVVGDNEPYSAREGFGYTLDTHGDGRGLANALIEIRQDLIDTDHAAIAWAERLVAGQKPVALFH